MSETKRIAMWSGPRNISTAMMYSFHSRSDTYCSDEPLYSHYLFATGIQHPSASEVINEGETDWRKIVEKLTSNSPDGSEIWYQKHMCHHIIEGMELHWIELLTNCFLIRNPREVLLSLAKKTEVVDAWATGLPQQAIIIDRVLESNSPLIIVDVKDILLDPNSMLQKICASLEIPFDQSMLSWKAGPKDCDGNWAHHWYDSVWKSTGFAEYQLRLGELSDEHESVLQEVMPIYERLHALRLV